MKRKVVWHNGAVDGYLSDLAQFPDDGIVVEILANRIDKPLEDYMIEMRYKIAEKLFEIKQ